MAFALPQSQLLFGGEKWDDEGDDGGMEMKVGTKGKL
jgi:hypothetical protein